MPQRSVTTIRNQVYQILKEDICNGTYHPGQWLQENDLAAQLSVSRSPVREALRQLVADGLVVEVPNKGVFVKEITLRDIEEIFDLRVLMENYAISRLRNNLTSSGIERLLSCQTQLEQAYLQDDLRRYTQIDAELHELFIQLSGNSLLESMYGRMLSLFQQFRIYSLLSRKRFDESNEEHKNIVHCLLKGDLSTAQSINRTHLQLAREIILEYLATRDAGKLAQTPERPVGDR